MGLKLDSPSGDSSDSHAEFGFNVGGGMDFASLGITAKWGAN